MINFGNTLNILRKDPNNVGDFWASPVEYFDFLKGTTMVDPQRDYSLNAYAMMNKQGRRHVQILGGGGVFIFHEIALINESKKINPFTQLVCWGAGHNNHGAKKIELDGGLPKYLKDWALVGVRDYDQGYEWVPCVSCLHPAFDKKYEVEHEYVVYEHKDYKIHEGVAKGCPRMDNSGNNLEEKIKFLASGDTVITRTYHGVYWATLLNKKVVILLPFSSKFDGLKHKHPTCDESTWKDKAKESQTYPESLKESREANMKFAVKVKDLIGK